MNHLIRSTCSFEKGISIFDSIIFDDVSQKRWPGMTTSLCGLFANFVKKNLQL